MADGAPISLYNSLSRRAEPLRPLVPGEVGLYTCGPTVYSYAHLGNMRPYVFSDTLRRVLEWKGLRVRQVVNITDVGHTVGESDLGEDKVEAAARRELKSVREVTAHYTEAYLRDLARLNVRTPSELPRASDYVPQMIEFAKVLDERGYTYQADSGLYFDTSRSPGYGTLAQISMEGQREGARLEAVPGKRNKADFAVWRTEAPGQRRVMRWESPWGTGVPGWHLECSVMSIDLLGRHFDIHTGGVDHREIHHVNEIAQSEAFLGEAAAPWVSLWLHNEFVLLRARKVSKSEDGGPLLQDLVDAGVHPLAYRYFLLTANYRSQLELTDAAVQAASSALRRLVGRAEALRPLPDRPTRAAAEAAMSTDAGRAALRRLDEAVSDDLNTPRALADLNTTLRGDDLPDTDRAVLLAAADAVLGLGLATLSAADLTGRTATTAAGAAVQALLARREDARQRRDWAESDRLRAEIADAGWRVVDTPEGPVLEPAS
ncbi:cysteine--tRNA ligase [Dactylosporangium vinaceum]|uniref:Cysteine--tRNA ligase n=1 Tax=Dactylosporangium vinaceum TaxID=53362 RepID=A0ABV5M1F2_9ACTN|nr:cysteine--tRNA ligase [Dactylosporangium vinaceum]UAB99184.1 cysteine--tRNA ligase [Dactylosporangium vinaceum]